jgi:erythromycin esterase
VLSAKDYAARIAERNRKRQAVVGWLKENTIPINTVEAGNGFADLQPLKKVFKDVRFVGLGEETHGAPLPANKKAEVWPRLFCDVLRRSSSG